MFILLFDRFSQLYMVQIIPKDVIINGDSFGIFFVICITFISFVKSKKELGKYSNCKEKFLITYFLQIYFQLWESTLHFGRFELNRCFMKLLPSNGSRSQNVVQENNQVTEAANDSLKTSA